MQRISRRSYVILLDEAFGSEEPQVVGGDSFKRRLSCKIIKMAFSVCSELVSSVTISL